MRRIIVRLFAAVGAITLALVAALAGILFWEWPHTPPAPSGRVPPPWGSLSAVIEEAHDRGEAMPSFIKDAKRGPAADGDTRLLVLSAGGEYGAFGAGALIGWTKTGHRPVFDVVTGLSVGSILAPFAFLGPQYDERLKLLEEMMVAVVDRYSIKDIGPIDLLRAIWGHGFPVSAKIESILRTFFDDRFISQVARQHADGRNLYVGSTDVTVGRVVIWDLGAIAASERPDRARRFQDAILASIAVPVVMPTRYIETGEPGTYAMQVDGSFLAPIFMGSLIENSRDLPQGLDIYVIVNNRLKRPQPLEAMSPRLIDLIPRLFYLVHTSQFERAMDVLLLQSRIDNSRIQVLAIPENEGLPFSLDFSNQEIKDLFRLGIKTGQDSNAWTTLPAGGLPAYWAPPGMARQDTGTAGRGG